jgi:hypothetical protein
MRMRRGNWAFSHVSGYGSWFLRRCGLGAALTGLIDWWMYLIASRMEWYYFPGSRIRNLSILEDSTMLPYLAKSHYASHALVHAGFASPLLGPL